MNYQNAMFHYSQSKKPILTKKASLKLDNYEIFEAIRKKSKGGSMIGAHKALKPVLIKEHSDEYELIVIEIKVRNREIRVITGYGPQESWNEEQRIPFFVALEEEIVKAELFGKSVILEMDSNSKLGPSFIKSDPHSQSPNGKILSEMIIRQGLVVVNGLDNKCTGAITRMRVTKDNTERSIIVHVIITEDMEEDLESLVVDEERNHVLTRFTKSKNGIKETKSDHNVLITKFKLKWNRRMKSNRIELYNLKNKDDQKKFKEITSHETYLSEVFDNIDNLNCATDEFIRRLNKVIKDTFKKIRIKDKPNKEIEELFEKRKLLRNKKDNISKIMLEDVEVKLAEKCAETNFNKIKAEISKIDVDEGDLTLVVFGNLRKR